MAKVQRCHISVVTLQGKARDTLTQHTKKDPMLSDPNLVSRGDREAECNARVATTNNQSAEVEIKYEVDSKKNLSGMGSLSKQNSHPRAPIGAGHLSMIALLS